MGGQQRISKTARRLPIVVGWNWSHVVNKASSCPVLLASTETQYCIWIQLVKPPASSQVCSISYPDMCLSQVYNANLTLPMHHSKAVNSETCILNESLQRTLTGNPSTIGSALTPRYVARNLFGSTASSVACFGPRIPATGWARAPRQVVNMDTWMDPHLSLAQLSSTHT